MTDEEIAAAIILDIWDASNAGPVEFLLTNKALMILEERECIACSEMKCGTFVPYSKSQWMGEATIRICDAYGRLVRRPGIAWAIRIIEPSASGDASSSAY